jgi:ABC-2 type transport system ATP-binding protein
MFESISISKKFKGDNGHFWSPEVKVLTDLNFRVNAGRVVGFLGANGAGKTTFIKILMGFIRPSSGEIVFDKKYRDINKNIRSIIGYLPERPFFYPHLTGREFAYFMGEISDIKRKDISVKIEHWAPRFRIDFALDRKIRDYSKGMLQRLGFLVTLIHDPELVVLDEPLSGLDPIGRKELKDIIVEINKLGKTIFFSSHILSDVEQVSEDIVFLKNGVVDYSGPVKNLIETGEATYSICYYTEKDIFKGKKLRSNYYQCSVAEGEKDNLIKSMISNNAQIDLLIKEKSTLEEVLYLKNEK